MMAVTNKSCERACHGYLGHFFSRHSDAALQKRVLKAFRLLTTSEKPLTGEPAGWAAGLIYVVANRDRQPCGVFVGLPERLQSPDGHWTASA